MSSSIEKARALLREIKDITLSVSCICESDLKSMKEIHHLCESINSRSELGDKNNGSQGYNSNPSGELFRDKKMIMEYTKERDRIMSDLDNAMELVSDLRDEKRDLESICQDLKIEVQLREEVLQQRAGEIQKLLEDNERLRKMQSEFLD